jgi:hypothetical protein
MTTTKTTDRIISIVSTSGATRYFIALGYAGFDSAINNGGGYATAAAARAASLRYERKGTSSRVPRYNGWRDLSASLSRMFSDD